MRHRCSPWPYLMLVPLLCAGCARQGFDVTAMLLDGGKTTDDGVARDAPSYSDSTTRDAPVADRLAPSDGAPQDGAPQDGALQDSAPQDGSKGDSAPDVTPHDSTAPEAAPPDVRTRDTTAPDMVVDQFQAADTAPPPVDLAPDVAPRGPDVVITELVLDQTYQYGVGGSGRTRLENRGTVMADGEFNVTHTLLKQEGPGAIGAGSFGGFTLSVGATTTRKVGISTEAAAGSWSVEVCADVAGDVDLSNNCASRSYRIVN